MAASLTGRRPCRLLLLLAALLLPAFAQAQADYVREQSMDEGVAASLLTGDAVYLQLATGRRFLALYQKAAKPRAGIVIVHGPGAHPDWSLVHTLRTALAQAGYATLSVQMPIAADNARPEDYAALMPEAAARIAAAVAFLHAAGLERVALISHSLGSRMADAYVTRTPRAPIDAWVVISLPGTFADPTRLHFPVLDIYGENDVPAVTQNAAARAAAIHLLRGAAQVVVAGAGHLFDGYFDRLTAHVRTFLDRTFP